MDLTLITSFYRLHSYTYIYVCRYLTYYKLLLKCHIYNAVQSNINRPSIRINIKKKIELQLLKMTRCDNKNMN